MPLAVISTYHLMKIFVKLSKEIALSLWGFSNVAGASLAEDIAYLYDIETPMVKVWDCFITGVTI